MRSEREKITGKVAAATLRLNANRYELPPDETPAICCWCRRAASRWNTRAGMCW